MKTNRNHRTHWGSAQGTSRGVLKESIDDDPQYPMYGYIEELDTFLDGVADGPWLVQQDEESYQLLSKKGGNVLGVFYGPEVRGTADYIAKVNPRNIRKVIKDIVRLKNAYEDQSKLFWQVIEERNELMAQLMKRSSH
jgi:hypothetical protein